MAEKNGIYRRYNGSGWDIIYLKTTAGQVIQSSTKVFLNPSTNKINGKAFGTISNDTWTPAAITLYAGDIALSSSDNTTIADKLAALQNLDADLTAIAGLTGTSGFLKKTAANTWALDTTVLTSDNYSTTLASVYQAKFTDGSATIASVSSDVVTIKAGVSQSGGAIGNSTGTDITLAKVAKTGAFSDLSGTSDVVTASSNITDGYIVVGDGGSKGVKSGSTTIGSLVALANGKTKSIVLTAFEDDDNYYILCGTSAKSYGTTIDRTTSGVYSIQITSSTNAIYLDEDNSGSTLNAATHLYRTTASGYVIEDIDLTATGQNALQIGDVLLITQTDVPDFWYTGSTGLSKTFSKLETTKVDLTDYVTNTSLASTLTGYSQTSHTHTTTLASDSGTSTVTLAYGGKYKLTAGGTSVVFTMPSSDNTNTWRSIQVAGTNKLTDTSTALNFLNTGNVTFTYDNGLKASVDKNKVFYGTDTPSGAVTNDIWIDTNNSI